MKIQVPEGMLTAAMAGLGHAAGLVGEINMMNGLNSALRWLAENPIVPNMDQAEEIYRLCHGPTTMGLNEVKAICDTWQRRMFLAPEPEVPKAVKGLLAPRGEYSSFTVPDDDHDKHVIEAYRRGCEGK